MNMLPQVVDPPDLYPDDDGLPMSDNTLQFTWIVTIQGNLDILFRDDPDVFVGGNLLWYAVQGSPAVRTAPDAMVVFGRPKVRRGSYKQWQEGGIAPQVVFEVLSPGNRDEALQTKFEFYQRHGVEEHYLFDPDEQVLEGWLRAGAVLQPIPQMDGWISPRLKIRFDLSSGELRVFRPNGEPFLTFLELGAQRDQEHQARQKAEKEAQKAEKTAQKAKKTAQKAEEVARLAQEKAEEATLKAERLAAQLRALGIEPDA